MCASFDLHAGASPGAGRLARILRLAAALCLISPAWSDDIVVIVHKDNTSVVDRAYVQQLYVGAVRGWPDGTPAFVLDQPDGSAGRELFSASVLQRSPANVRAIWAQNIFTGRGLPPKVAADEEMKRLVASNRSAIGYIRASQLDATVRAALR